MGGGSIKDVPAEALSDPTSDPTPASTPLPASLPTSPPTSNSTSNSTSDSTPNSPVDPSLEAPPGPSIVSRSLGERLRDVFPPGLEGTSTSLRALPYTFTPQHLLDVFRHNTGGRHATDTVVTSAWYGKQTKSARHEFIVIVIEDLHIPGLKNCMAIDRNQGPASPGGSTTVSAVSSSNNAYDAFRVAYDGDLNRFLTESLLTPYHILEQLTFDPSESLPLHTLVTLVHYISEQHTKYNPVDTNCYWFTGLIWDCVRKLCPGAAYVPHLPGKKGRIAFARNLTNPVQVRNVVREVQAKMGLAVSELDGTNEVGEEIIMTESIPGLLSSVEIANGDFSDLDFSPRAGEH